ncbi:uncharacterized protein LOC100117667 isoform X1 [Nasonia vitripennis]|uniref:SLC26A/SulP transporter domain-containing protein n=2 Tax=Nasonia vitripennis TaxID=7425 RepID=A0A7M7ISD3_NASVI|nr:uncharacterized protein LOC100117667 isoform X1 [Nasonia vitripennis]XP_016841840.1 uncharacterized protein LOC100117667 isoform X1 [Nasonia vitripennis]XP_031788532.1 uncharacterized protein LOC100117667 isoform X1 [Nasonia vitripennis]XP_031788533.1 uncharacterized protein LOC100117667 isoform X1 [Nasonia vitripennis]XP_031788534.1 uncharacterized protein LOC100117667 isoform X1 [Nasonia vitripennis]XP_032456499.1 uncharacterized protein LOC100117667 isoform X1 [Nasonia vitripennis]XP_03
MRRQSKRYDIWESLRRRIPIVVWLPQYSWGNLLQDALAGTTVGLTVIPQGIAYAVVAGLPPQYGLYSSFMGCFVYIFFGSTKEVTVGPTAIMGLMAQPFVLTYGDDFAVLLCFLTGCLITAMGLLRLGFLVDFISLPVICGFTNAATIIIGSSQISKFFGISGRSESFIDALKKFIQHFMEIQLWDTVLGVCSIVTLVLLKNLPGKRHGNWLKKCMWLICLARNAVVVITGMVLAYCLSLHGQEPFKITGNITAGLPSFQPPPFTTIHKNETYTFVDMMNILGSSVISVPLIALLESIAVAKAFAKGKKLDSNQEMIAVGLCNVFGSFARSMPTTGSFSRTAVNNASDVKTPMGGLVTGALVLLACGLLTSTFKFIPKATLASVIIVAMYYMLEIRVLQVLWKTKKLDLIPLVVTWLVCLSAGLDIGMIVGIATNLGLLLYGTARPGLLIEERTVNDIPVLFVSPLQSLKFPAAEYLREQIMTWCDISKNTNIIVLDGRNIIGIDATVAKNLSLLNLDLESKKQRLIFWNWCENARKTLVAFDSSTDSHFRTFGDLVELEEILTSAEIIRKESSNL